MCLPRPLLLKSSIYHKEWAWLTNKNATLSIFRIKEAHYQTFQMRYCLFIYYSWSSLKLMKSEISIWGVWYHPLASVCNASFLITSSWPLWVDYMTVVSHWLLILNSSCNIAIYLHKDPKFKAVLKEMVLSKLSPTLRPKVWPNLWPKLSKLWPKLSAFVN